MNPAFSRSEQHGWIAALAVALLLHLALAALFADRVWVTPLGTSGVLMVGLAFSLRQAVATQGDMRLRWAFLATSFALWIAGYAASAYSQLTHADPGYALPYLLIFELRGIPWFLALVRTSDRKVLAHTRAFDIAQTALFAIAALILYFPELSTGQTVAVPYSGDRAATYHDLANLLIASLAFLFARLQPTKSERAFAHVLATLLISYTLLVFVENHVLIDGMNVPPGSASLLLGDLPIILFVAEALRTARRQQDAQPLPASALRSTILLFVPALMPVGTIAMAFAIAHAQPVAGALLGLIAIALHAARSALTQGALQRAQTELTQARDAMAQLAQRDELTGLANRRRFTKALEASWRQCALRDKPLSVLFIDIDAFKQYNDALGHTAGDDCLRRVADILLANAAGPEHTIVRYGGEEFVALLPEADALAARRIAEQMRCAVEQANIEHPAASTGFVTISIGVATGYASREDASTSTLVKDADAALYWAKNKGRNRVVGPRNAGATPHSLGQH